MTKVPQFESSAWFVDLDGGRLYGREVGDGDPTIVVVHGGPDFDHGYMLPEMDALAASFRLVYYDQRGRGRSTLACKPDSVTIQSEVDDLDAIRSQLGLDQIVVLGHSWGGLLAMEYAIRHRDRVSHLVLVNTAPVSRSQRRLSPVAQRLAGRATTQPRCWRSCRVRATSPVISPLTPTTTDSILPTR